MALPGVVPLVFGGAYRSPNEFEELQARDNEGSSRRTLLTIRVQS